MSHRKNATTIHPHFNNQYISNFGPSSYSIEANKYAFDTLWAAKAYCTEAKQYEAVKRAIGRAIERKPFVYRRTNLHYEVDGSDGQTIYHVYMGATGNIWEAKCQCKGNAEHGLLCYHIAAAHMWAAELAAMGRLIFCAEHPDRFSVGKDGLCQECLNDLEEVLAELGATKPPVAPSFPATATPDNSVNWGNGPESFVPPTVPLPAPATHGPRCKRCNREVIALDDLSRDGLCLKCDESDLFG